MRRLGLLAAFLCLAGLPAFAQGTRTDDGQRAPKPRKSIRVLQHPYDIASFYRSHDSGPYGVAPDPYFGLHPAGAPGTDPYAIASFYRGGTGFYAPYWTSDAPRYHRGGARARRPRGEVFGFFPTVFAPALPLAEYYRER